ncbi:MAG: GreA/GreB family elongation factor [Actinomycetota bacterium]
MQVTHMTGPMKASMESRLADLDARIEALDPQRLADDSAEATALTAQLMRERSDIADALRDAVLIDEEPFDTDAIEVGDTVTIRDADGAIDRYVLVDGKVRARSDWVSVSSPLGAAILGRSKGDSVHVESPAGRTSYEILSFERASEDPLVDPVRQARGGRTVVAAPAEAFLG